MKNIIGFFGGDSQVGTTMIATSVAECLSQRNRRVLLVCGSGKFGDGFVHLSGKHSLDDLKAGIISGKVGEEDLMQTLEECRGLWILPPVRNPLAAKYFPENTHQILLAALDEKFDYVVIDGGDDANLGLTISALNLCHSRFFVVTQQNKGLQRYVQLQKNVLDAFKKGLDANDELALQDEEVLLEKYKELGVEVMTPDVEAFKKQVNDFYLNDSEMVKDWDMDLFEQIKAMGE